MNATTEQAPVRLAAPAPTNRDDEAVLKPADLEAERNLHALSEEWAYWCRTRRLYAPPAATTSLLGRLTKKTSVSGTPGGPDAISSAELAAFHLGVVSQPMALDRQCFELHYFWRVKNVKAAAAQLGIGRQHWYTLVSDFRKRAYRASREIYAANQDAAQALGCLEGKVV
jgi:hypothetical protein